VALPGPLRYDEDRRFNPARPISITAMLIIRNEQMRVFQAEAAKDFVGATLVHLRRCFPVDCERLGEAQARKVIREGIARAARRGIDVRNDVRQYISVMFALGSGFAEDPQLPWAGEALANAVVSPSEHMSLLYDQVVDYLERVAGTTGAHYMKALVRARRLSLDDFATTRSGAPAHIAAPLLRGLWDEKLETLPAETAASLVGLGEARSARYGLTTRAGAAFYVVLMFMLGSEFDRDPLYPWAGLILLDAAEPEAKARRLHTAAMSQIDETLQLLRARREA
jgi:hypothetical protein